MRLLFPAAVVVALFAAWWMIAHRGPAPLVVYCAHDSIYSEKILRDFEKRAGIPVAIRFDTEATKSLGLVESLIAEKDAPRCDVFWNNEPLGTMDLAERGILEPYKGAGWQRIPEKFRDADGRWTGFAARMRVKIFNTKTAEKNRGLLPVDLKKWAIAKPLYGTTLTHYAVLWHKLGADGLKSWHRECRDAGMLELNGNAAVKNAVAHGVCEAGFTDSDDVFAAQDDGQPVRMFAVYVSGGNSIVIPNTVAIVRGTGRGSEARKLVDFLLSEETELTLARSKSRQIPLGPIPIGMFRHLYEKRKPAANELPADLQWMMEASLDAVNLTQLGPARAECLAWLKSEYLK